MTKKRVGIMGGTFNPIHLGHLLIAESAYEAFDLDEILFIPCGKSHLKEDVLDAKTRISMIGEAIEDNPHFALSTIEVEREGYSYSYETIAELKAKNPHVEYYFIVGADSLMYMDNWMKPEGIFNEVTVLVASRKGTSVEELNKKIDELKAKYEKADIRVLPISNTDISSSEIRERVKEGKSIRYMVHYKVIEFINKNHIYSKEND
ncbi:MAG: nicotinate-nucleotide adenylyltransferase [Lachnospiraceae bacterium]|nr:nicotinate-nucleotide adenylyltransferase [Lachnospiraceae bacterium]MBO7601216.1 nicotinate-nucleotide adenylyltransferase [Lachnospiraceae bacterium]